MRQSSLRGYHTLKAIGPAAFSILHAQIYAPQEEYKATCQMLNYKCNSLKTAKVNNNNTYTFSRINRHYMAIRSLPDGQYSNNSTAGITRDMVRSFPNLRFALIVGIRGAAPTQERDIPLGDVIVSKPQGILRGVRVSDRQFQQTGQLNVPPQVLLGVLPEMQRRHNNLRKPNRTAKHLKVIDNMPNYQHPAEDRLYRADYKHKGGKSCADCKANRMEEHAPRNLSREVIIHYSIIASANSVIKNAKEKDQYSKDLELNVLCFKMEAGGLMNNFPCLVIPGICNYSDSHKNDKWHKYAALTAAAYARELLHIVKPTKVAPLPS
ncbi:nucleoside phosphorylase domain-containing protein [Thelonectria olida]|uniref:Nucleoside phosphorylase domain-containing protein n=1 Tax=Thelonectria olida TaxID=1576542 RepID=A0A9P8VL99_9HYPO|nr:nucleoside phosphorylase domain-containing protein [Thelonectria olida]